MPAEVVPGQPECLRFPHPHPLELSSAILPEGVQAEHPAVVKAAVTQPHGTWFGPCGEALTDMVTHLLHFFFSPVYSKSHIGWTREIRLPLI